MSVAEALPVIFPLCGFIFICSITGLCCLRRQISERYVYLEQRIQNLEQQIHTKNISRVDPVPAQPQYPPNQYVLPTYPQPTAPYPNTQIQQPATNPYLVTYSI